MNAQAALACPRCSGPVDVKSRHVAVAGSAVRIYCSDDCLRGVGEIAAAAAAVEQPPRRKRWLLVAGFALGGGAFALYRMLDREDAANEAVAVPVAIAAPKPAPTPPPPPE